MARKHRSGKRDIKEKFMEQRFSHPPLVPKTAKQAQYIKALRQHNQVISLGCAGTGKTYVAATLAAELYARGHIDKIVLTRPNMPSGRSLGSFPGSLEEKMAPWTAPVTQILRKYLGGAYDTAVRAKAIEVIPFETMRGATFDNAFVLLDEAQNTSPEEMQMFCTRIGEESRVVINGDLQQSDIKSDSGLAVLMSLISRQSLPVPVIEFDADDIVRSGACEMWVRAFAGLPQRQNIAAA